MALLDVVPTAWWFHGFPGRRTSSRGTYDRYPLDAVPPLDPLDHEDLAWLPRRRRVESSITDTADQRPVRQFNRHGLEGLAVVTPLPASFRRVIDKPRMLDGIRSGTGCYLDLGDFAMRVDEPENGTLIHFLSDQQWVRHWLLYRNKEGAEAVVTTTEPIGFSSRPEWPTPQPPLRPSDVEIDRCATTFTEFLYRFWIESELASAPSANDLDEPFASYARRCRVRNRPAPGHDPMW